MKYILTVIIGKIGPKISSFMTAESSGGSSKIVGSISLEKKNTGILALVRFNNR